MGWELGIRGGRGYTDNGFAKAEAGRRIKDVLLISKGVFRETLGNGLCLLLKRVETTPIVAMVVYTKSGTLHDPEELSGVTDLLSRLHFLGSEKHPSPLAVNQTVLSVGGTLSCAARPNSTIAYSVIPSAYFQNALGVHADALQAPLLDRAAIDEQRAALQAEGALRAQSPAFRATELLHSLVFRKHRMGRLRFSPKPALDQLEREALLAQHRSHFRPDNVIVAVVGNIDVQSTLRSLADSFGLLQPLLGPPRNGRAEEPQTSPRLIDEVGPGSEAHLRVGFAAPGEMEGHRYPLEILNCLIDQGLLGRLFQDLPERRVVESWTSAYRLSSSSGLFSLAATVAPDSVQATEQVLFEALERLSKEPIPVEELARAKSFLRTRFLSSQQFMHKMADALAHFEALGGHHLVDVYLGKLQAVTAEEIQRVCAERLAFERACVVQVRPESARQVPTDLKSLYLAVEPFTGASGARPSVRWRSTLGDVRIGRPGGGPTVIVQSSKKVPIVALGAFFAGGRWNEQPQQAGWTQLCLNIASGTGLARRLGALGCSLYPLVTRDYFGLALSCLPEDIKLAGKLFLNLIRRPAFDEEGVRREALALASVAASRRNSEQRCLDLLLEALYGDHLYGWPSLGSAEQLAEVRYEDMLAWHQEIFRRDRMVVSVLGDVDSELLLDQVLEVWRGARAEQSWAPPAAPPVREGRILEAAIARPLSYQMLGFPACSAASPERAGLMILQAALRDEAWGFHFRLRESFEQNKIWSIGPLWGQLAGALCIYMVSRPDQEASLRERVVEAFEKISAEPMPQDVLERARQTVLGKHQLRQQSPSAVMLLAARDALLGLGPEERLRLPDVLHAVSRDQLHSWTQQWLRPEGMSAGVVRG